MKVIRKLLIVFIIVFVAMGSACQSEQVNENELDAALIGIWEVPFSPERTRRHFFVDGRGMATRLNWGQYVTSEFQWYTYNGQLRVSVFDDWNFEWGGWSTTYYTINGGSKLTQNLNGTITTSWNQVSSDPGMFHGSGVTVPGAPTFAPGDPQFAD